MKKTLLIGLILVLLLVAMPVSASGPVTKGYDDVVLYDWGQGNFAGLWDLTECNLTLSYTINMSNQASGGWTPIQVGIREVGGGNLDPNGLGGWMQANWQLPATDPNELDDDDHLLLVDHGWASDELDYDATDPDTIVAPFGTYNSFAFWFDRDGVNQWQAQQWDMIDGVTYNTGGIYDIEIGYHAVSANQATMFASINDYSQGFYTVSGVDSPPDIYPAGRSFTGDMTQMQVFYGRGGGGGAVTVSNITVTGCLDPNVGKELCKKDGWKLFTDPSFKNQGQCVSYFAEMK